MRKTVLFVVRHKSKPALILTGLVFLLFIFHSYSLPLITGILAPLRRPVVVLDPGHGGIDGGANCTGFLEKEINLAIAKKVRTKLQKAGVKVILTRDRDIEPNKLVTQTLSRHRRDLLARINLIKKTNPDLFLSIHVNANPRRPATTGPMVFYNRRVPASPFLAETIQKGLNSLAAKKGFKEHLARPANYFLLDNTPYPGVIIEVGFMTNQREKKFLQTNDYQQQVAEAVTRSVLRYFNDKPAARQIKTDESVIFGANPQEGIKVYFPEKNKDTLAGETILGYQPVASSSDNITDSVRIAVQGLISGPRDERLEPVFDSRVKISEIGLNNGGILSLNFSGDIASVTLGSHEEFLALRSLVETVCQFPEINGLRLLIDGRPADTLGEHMNVSGVLIPARPKLKAAIVIDDLAGGNQGLEQMMAINRPLTMAVMPKRGTSRQTAELVYQKGFQVFLHLPMEPETGKAYWLGGGAIKCGMTPDQAAKQVIEDLEDVPHAIGMNNHIGSKITKRRDLMLGILRVAKSRNLIVLDSRTTEDTVIPIIAKELHMQILERSVFLDEINSVPHIQKQIRKLADCVKEKGSAVAIGHVGITGKNTAGVLAEMVPWLEEQGIELVFASQLVGE